MEAPALFARFTAANHSRATLRTLFLAVLVVLTSVSPLLKSNSGFAQTATESTAAGQNTSLPSPGQVQDMKLLAPDVGWVLQQNRLYWTVNNGGSWENITPRGAETLTSVYFLNKAQGWTVFSNTSTAVDTRKSFGLARTTDGGRTWDILSIDGDLVRPNETIDGVSSLSFIDSLHGWLVMKLKSSTHFPHGFMLRACYELGLSNLNRLASMSHAKAR